MCDVAIDGMTFPDPIFRRVVLESFDRNGDGAISEEEANAVTEIDVRGMGIASLKGIERFPALTSLKCSGNRLTILDVVGNGKLAVLKCSDNRLTALDVRGNAELTELSCGKNHLTALDVRWNDKLAVLKCSDNRLTKLDVRGNAELTELSCGKNHLTALDVRQNSSLSVLDCSDNRLTELDVRGNPSLTVLDCGCNRLSALDVSNNLRLRALYCGDNCLTALNVRRLGALTELDCYGQSVVAEGEIVDGRTMVYLGKGLEKARLRRIGIYRGTTGTLGIDGIVESFEYRVATGFAHQRLTVSVTVHLR